MRTEIDFFEKLESISLDDFPDFYTYKKPLEMGLWVLWVAKEKLNIKKLTAQQIALYIRDKKEISISTKSIINSFNRAQDKIHIYSDSEGVFYEIMRPGKEYLWSQIKEGSVKLFYFEPGKQYSSKRMLSKNIFNNLRGELRVIDPYCGERTLDILKDVRNDPVKFLTRMDNLKDRDKNRLLREIKDFKSENMNIEFRDYPNKDIHDRYIISSQFLIILGQSIKDLGVKESFAICLSNEANKNIIETLNENFEKRWYQSTVI